MTDYRIIAKLRSDYSNTGLYRSSGLVIVWVVEASDESEAFYRKKKYIMDHQLTDFDIVSMDIKDANEKRTIQISFDKGGK